MSRSLSTPVLALSWCDDCRSYIWWESGRWTARNEVDLDCAHRPTCCWYALCYRPAVGWALATSGPVAICQRCADRHDVTPKTFA